MAGDAVESGAMGITVKNDRKNPLDELRRVSGIADEWFQKHELPSLP